MKIVIYIILMFVTLNCTSYSQWIKKESGRLALLREG